MYPVVDWDSVEGNVRSTKKCIKGIKLVPGKGCCLTARSLLGSLVLVFGRVKPGIETRVASLRTIQHRHPQMSLPSRLRVFRPHFLSLVFLGMYRTSKNDFAHSCNWMSDALFGILLLPYPRCLPQSEMIMREIIHLLCKPGAHGKLSVQPAPTSKSLSHLTVEFIRQYPVKPILHTGLIWCVSGPTH